MPRISAIINTRNEEKNIRACLETVKWCDEIIVVDMESDDKTKEIAREYTDKIYDHQKILAFDAARKFALEKATGDWIMVVDADERIPRSLGLTLRQIAESNPPFDICRINRKNYLLGRWIQYSGWGNDLVMRFFRNGSIEYTGDIHDFEIPKGTIHDLPKTDQDYIIHFNYFDSYHFVEKLNTYTTIESVQLHEKKVDFRMSYLLTKPVKVFWDRYFMYKGYKDGVPGFLLSVYMSFYRFLTWAKYWEIISKIDSKGSYRSIEAKIVEEYNDAEDSKL